MQRRKKVPVPDDLWDVPTADDVARDLGEPVTDDLDEPVTDDLGELANVPTADDVARDLGLRPPCRRAHSKTPNRRQRAFAKALAIGMRRRDAQIFAGYKANRKHALLLLANQLVAAEIERWTRLRSSARQGELFG